MTDVERREYEQRLKRRLNILKEEMEAGTLHINPGLSVIESLKAVRYGPDGEIDLDTVDDGVRSLALAMEMVHDRRETKKIISLPELQRGYFENVRGIFGS